MNKIVFTLFIFISLLHITACSKESLHTIYNDNSEIINGILTIPRTYKIIEANKYKNKGITRVNFHADIIEIQDNAFAGNKITSLTLPEKLRTLGNGAFKNNRLTEIVLPDTLNNIGKEAFKNNRLTEIVLPDTLNNIGKEAFINNPLTKVKMSVKKIPLFDSSSKQLTKIFPDREITYIFKEDTNNKQKSRTSQKKLQTIINNDLNKKKKITTLNEYTELKQSMKKDRIMVTFSLSKTTLQAERGTRITAITITDLTAGATGTFSTTLPKSFSINPNSGEITGTMPDTTDDNGQYAVTFTGTAGKYDTAETTIDITVQDIIKPTLLNGVLAFPKDHTTIKKQAYERQKIKSVIFSNNLQSIGDNAFRHNKLKKVIIPISVTDIGIYAFANNLLANVEIRANITILKKGIFNNNKITKLTLPNSIIDIQMQVFENNEIVQLSLPQSLQTIGNNAFYRNKITALKIPNTVETIGDGAFKDNKIQSVTLSSSLTTIGAEAFMKNKIQVLTIPNNVTKIKNLAFRENEITTLTLSNNLNTISHAAFFKNKITTLTLPESITIVEKEAFSDNKIETLFLSPNLTEIKHRAFTLNKISSVALPEGLLSLGNGAFSNNQLTEIRIPHTVTYIGSHAFSNNKNLSKVTLTKHLFNSFKSLSALADAFVKEAEYFDYDNKKLIFTPTENKQAKEKVDNNKKKLEDLKKLHTELEEEIGVFNMLKMIKPGKKVIKRGSPEETVSLTEAIEIAKTELKKVNKEIKDIKASD